MSSDFFRDVTFDPAQFARQMRLPPAPVRYVIYFTPRSGSSRLTEILGASGALGYANEAFNPGFLPRMAQACNARSLEDYIEVVLRRHGMQGVYGCEITAHQLHRVFPDPALFLRHFGQARAFWLIRRDIVAQAVSLAKMVTLGVTHSAQVPAADRAAADRRFAYDRRLIRKWLDHILAAERQTEAFLAAHGIVPLRLTYERTTAMSAADILALFAGRLGVDPVPDAPETLSHVKIGTPRNRDHAERFRAEEAAYLEQVAAERAPWLAAAERDEAAV